MIRNVAPLKLKTPNTRTDSRHGTNLAVVIALCGLMTLPAHALDVVWSGSAGDLNWSTTNNWTGGVLPGENDRARFNAAQIANQTVTLGTNQVIDSLMLSGSVGSFTINGNSQWSLTLKSGKIENGGNGGCTAVLNCKVILGANGTWNMPEQYGNRITIAGELSDNGMGYGFTTGGGVNQSFGLTGTNNALGNIVIRDGGLVMSGAAGVFKQGTLTLNDAIGASNMSQLTLDNTILNTNRFGVNTTVQSMGNGGNVYCTGNFTFTQPIGRFSLQAGKLHLSRWDGTPTLKFASWERKPGTALTTSSLGSAIYVTMTGESVNTNGLWKPWASDVGFDPKFIKVNASGQLSTLATGDYGTLAASGNSATSVYQMKASTLALSANENVWALRFYPTTSGTQTLDLGANDLKIGSGAMLFYNGETTINSSGGCLRFGGNEIFVNGNVNGSGSKTIAIHAPIATDGGSSNYLVVANMNYDKLILDGEDRIGTYAGVYGMAHGKTIELGGASDRAITGLINGKFNLVKSGSGALTCTGSDVRSSGSTTVNGGRLVIGAFGSLGSATVNAGGRLETAAGITGNGNNTINTNGTLGGHGTFANNGLTLNAGCRLAPGTPTTIGVLTLGYNITLPTAAGLDVKLGAGTNDLLKINGSLTLPATDKPLNVSVADLSEGAENPKGRTYVVAKWTGNNPSTSPTWTVTTTSPLKLDVASAIVTVDTTTKQIKLSGLKTVPNGSVLVVR